MIQSKLVFFKPEHRVKYLIDVHGSPVSAWFMGGKFILDNYHIVEDAEIIKRIGSEKEIFK